MKYLFNIFTLTIFKAFLNLINYARKNKGGENYEKTSDFTSNNNCFRTAPVWSISAEDSQGGVGIIQVTYLKLPLNSYPNEVTILNNLSTDPSISDKVNVTPYSGRTSDDLNYDLSDQDVIVLRALSASVVDHYQTLF